MTKKKRLLLIVWACLLGMLSFIVGARGRAPTVWLISDRSFLSDYFIEDNSVHFVCHVEIYNSTREPVSVGLVAFFDEDHQAGLVGERCLNATDSSGAKSFLAYPGRCAFDVEFIGTHGSANEKQNRLLPDIQLVVLR